MGDSWIIGADPPPPDKPQDGFGDYCPIVSSLAIDKGDQLTGASEHPL